MKLFSGVRKTFSTMLGVMLVSMLIAACGNPGGGGGTPPASGGGAQTGGGKGCTKVGVLLPETASAERWDRNDRPLLTQKIEAIPGVKVDYYNAQDDPVKQQTQAEAALTKGDCILVVAPKNADTADAIVQKAKAQNVPVISYDRLIHSKDLNYYVSFDNVKVGELQGQYIVDNYQKYTSPGHNNLAMINGSQDDNNAILFRQGAMNKLKPLIDSGKLKLVYDQYTPGWVNDKARTEIEGVLTAQSNDLQIAYVANDGMANSVIAALKAKKLNGKVLVTGQDASVAGLQNILTGDQIMTVFKPFELEAQATADLVKALHDGTDPNTITQGVTTDFNGAKIPSVLKTPIAVDKTNVKVVIDSGQITKEALCQNLPAGTGGIC